MRVFIANFGRENYEWPTCRERGTIATMNDVAAQPLWEAGDKEAYIQSRMKGKTAAGISPTRPVAARWFNLMTIISESSGDLWVHREKDQLWWTISTSDPPTFVPKTEPVGDKRHVIVCHKPCEPWSNKNRNGNRLDWNGLHPRAKDFLSTEATLQQLSEDYAAYAKALINGDDLAGWHSRRDWRDKVERAKGRRAPGLTYNAKQISAYEMADTAFKTAAGANGQQELRQVKNKDFGFSSRNELEKHILALIELQEGLCTLTGLRLQYRGDHDDEQMLASLDRIDSAGHYSDGNLQVVCRFANMWKGASKDDEFRRLISIVRSIGSTELLNPGFLRSADLEQG